jgi:hypothetical protein
MSIQTDLKPEIEKKTADKKTYMREYKRKQYALKGDDMKERNRAYYAASKYGSGEDLKKYDKKVLPIMLRIRKELDKLSEIDVTLLSEVMQLIRKCENDMKEIDAPSEEEFKYF